MLSNKELKKYAIMSGNNINNVKKMYIKAQKEADSLGKGKDEKYVIQTLKDLLDIEESVSIEKLSKLFAESEYTNFDKFIEELISQDIPQESRPEMKIKNDIPENIDTTEENEIEEDLLKNINDKDEILDKDEKEDKELLYGED